MGSRSDLTWETKRMYAECKNEGADGWNKGGTEGMNGRTERNTGGNKARTGAMGCKWRERRADSRETTYNCSLILCCSKNIIEYSCRRLHYLSMNSFFGLHMKF